MTATLPPRNILQLQLRS